MLNLPPPDPGIEIVVASRGLSKGIAQTEGPQFLVRPLVEFGRVQVGAQWKNVSSAVADGEGAVFISVSPKLGPFQLGLGAAYRFQTGVPEPNGDQSWEFTGSVNGKLGKLGLRAAAVYSQDDLGSAKRSLFVEAGPTLELDKTTRLSASLARRNRVGGDDYFAFSIGLAKTVAEGVTLEGRLHDTDRSTIGFPYRRRGVISARMAF